MLKTGLLLVAVLLHVAYASQQYDSTKKVDYMALAYGYDGYHLQNYKCGLNRYKCDPYFPWRVTDGSCNNMQRPDWGEWMQKFKRLLPAAYNDGKQAPRSHSTVDYSPLNSPRDIANKIHYPNDYRNQMTYFSVVFGQIAIHDLSEIYIQKDKSGQMIQCTCESRNPDCLKIPIPKDDYYFKNQKCMVQIRSKEAINCDGYDKNYGPVREVLNRANAWLDLSYVYGNNEWEEKSLRAFYGGRLRVSYYKDSAGPLMPSSCPASTFHLVKKNNVCFHAGDHRVNQYPQLSSMHTIFVREHNRIADQLAKINPHWPEEKLYQETKRILNAIYQNIVYWEWLPLVIGPEIHNIFGLNTLPYGSYFEAYDPYINPNVAIEFATAAARYGHSLVRPYLSRANADYVTTLNSTLREVMFKPYRVVSGYNMDQYILGMLKDRAYYNPPHVNNELTNWLIVDHGNQNSYQFYSLPALNINRGRETGVAPYIFYRKLAGLNVPKTFDELTGLRPECIHRLKQVYKYVQDIDLYTGGSCEISVKGGIVGPTFAYILASGFRDWKYGDRWYFENSPKIMPYAFSLPQLDSIRKTRISSIICNTVYAKNVPYNAFLTADKGYNDFMPCKNVYQVNLNLWREQPVSYAKNTYNPY